MVNAVVDMQSVNCSRQETNLGNEKIMFSKQKKGGNEYETKFSMKDYLRSIGLNSLSNLFAKERITLDFLAIMTHDDLKAMGTDAFGTRFRLLKNIGKCIRKSEDNAFGLE
uniref:SAM domain-containing protein n=1 Tax=Wuchereria bancrofti TaxID=6293 RepID=A0A1I8EQ42_WUCBA